MIITCKKEIPLRWIGFAILPWASFTFNGYVLGVAFLFSLKKFVENPVGLTFILSLPTFVSIVLQPIISFLSDRIWTRYGRRKPFIMVSLIGTALCLILLPLMPNFWALLGVFMVFNMFGDLNSPMEPLQQEIIPPHERGRATGAMTWCSNLACMVFYFIAFGRFDDVRYFAGFPLSGETAIYWSGGLLTLTMTMLIMLGVKEVNQHSALRGQKLTPQNFFGGLLDRELWPVYMLVVGSAFMNFYAGLGPLSNLLYTDQWNYSKQEMGVNVAVGGIINVFAIGLLTVFADRLNRMRAYQTLICLSLLGNVFYYCYINFVLPDKRPSLVEIIVFGETLSILGILISLAYVPLVYDYVTRNKLGTYNAGAQLVARLTFLITLNGVGLFVWAYASVFQPPAGEMSRLVLQGEHNQKADVLKVIQGSAWTYPDKGTPAPASQIQVNSWQATGVQSEEGRCWEIRLRDPQSSKLAAQREKLNDTNSALIAREEMARDEAARLQQSGRSEEATRETHAEGNYQVRVNQLSSQIKAIDDQLASWAENFHQQTLKAFGARLFKEGDQIRQAQLQPAIEMELATAGRPDRVVLKKALQELARERPDIIDLRPLKLDQGYGVAVSALLPSGADPAVLERDLQTAVKHAIDPYDPSLLSGNAAPVRVYPEQALTLDLEIVENPLDTYVSPITRVVNLVLSFFEEVPGPTRRLEALAQHLRTTTPVAHIRVEAGPSPRTISLRAILPEEAPKTALVQDPLTARLQDLLGKSTDERTLAKVRSFYDSVEVAASAQKLTVIHPTLVVSYAPMKYDYMSGYLWMFLMGLIGIAITVAFDRMEARGLIRKRGVEEARAT